MVTLNRRSVNDRKSKISRNFIITKECIINLHTHNFEHYGSFYENIVYVIHIILKIIIKKIINRKKYLHFAQVHSLNLIETFQYGDISGRCKLKLVMCI